MELDCIAKAPGDGNQPITLPLLTIDFRLNPMLAIDGAEGNHRFS
jgi:hypothetical protein